MPKHNITSEIIDSLLRFLAITGTLSVSMIAPNMSQIFEKPLEKYLKKLDERARERELRRIVTYMKSRGLVDYQVPSENYDYGIQLTKEGEKRLEKVEIKNITIDPPESWDQKWRIIFFDIPESRKNDRQVFVSHLKSLGFQKLQLSVWIYPFPCRSEIEAITHYYEINKYTTYIETSYIDNQQKLRKTFRNVLSTTDS